MTSARLVAVKQLPETFSVKQGRSFLREVEFCLNADRPRVVLDCSKVRQLDSVGIQVLLRWLEEAMKRNGDVKLAAIPPGAAAILEFAGVEHLFEVFDSPAEAVNSFSQFPAKPFQQRLLTERPALSSRARRTLFEDRQSASHEGNSPSETTMRTTGRWLRRHIAGCLVLLFVAPLAAAVPLPQQEATPKQQAEVATSTQAQPRASDSSVTGVQAQTSQVEVLPDSPGALRSQDQSSSGPQPSQKPQSETQEPLGIGAATFVKTTGVAASRPAGAAIAPAKQRRARSILIKVGIIAGAGVAVGTVVALAGATPSRPH
jgi:anti-anti-sigma factor